MFSCVSVLKKSVSSVDSDLDGADPRFDSTSMNEFGKWFTWCQGCRHGGHADHITHVTTNNTNKLELNHISFHCAVAFHIVIEHVVMCS